MEAAVRQRNGRGQALTLPTIFARSTGALPSAIAIMRISGPLASTALMSLTRGGLPEPRRAIVRTLRDPVAGDELDQALVLWLPGPTTVTGEDVVELHLHGGGAVVAAVERVLGRLEGCSPAGPGDFTRRAFENGRLDLTQVEGLADLLVAETERQRASALAMVDGGLRRRVEVWQHRLLGLAARVEALIDFADEDDVAPDATLRTDLSALGDEMRAVLAVPPAERLRDGVRVALAGPPNSGKSTLLNALVGREAAIASPIAGTTRDLIEVPVDLDGTPIVFVDMAGLRDATDDAIEALGIARAARAILGSDLVLWLGKVEAAPHGNVVIIGAKCDVEEARPGVTLSVSAVTGVGLSELRSLILAHAAALLPAMGSLALSSHQRAAITSTVSAIERAAVQIDEVLCAEDLRLALSAFDCVTGRADTEAMLDMLFGQFCIGK